MWDQSTLNRWRKIFQRRHPAPRDILSRRRFAAHRMRAALAETQLLEDRTLLSGAAISQMVPDSAPAGPLTSVDLTFDETIQAATFTSDDVQIYGPDGSQLAITGGPVDSGDQLTFTVNLATPAQLPGTYRVLVGPDVLDAGGDAMNQDGDGVDGEAGDDQFEGTLTLDAVAQTVPVVQNFDGGDIESLPGWSFQTQVGKTIEISNADNPHSGQFHLQFGQTASSQAIGSAILELDLSADVGASDLTLDFWTKELTASSSNYMQIYVSGDGTSWQFVTTPNTLDSEYVHYAFDLDQMLSSSGVTIDGDVFIEFRHRGLATSHETTLDDVRIGRGLDVVGAAVASQSLTVPQVGPVSSIDVTFNEPIDGATFTASDVTLRNPVGETIALLNDPVDTGDQTTWTLDFASQTLSGDYAFSIGPDVRDLAGNLMNQSGNATNGRATDGYVSKFTIAAQAVTAPFTEDFEAATIGSLTGWSFSSTGSATVELTDQNDPPDGLQQLRFTQTASGTSQSTADLKLDLAAHAGATDLTVDFFTQETSTSSSNYIQFWVSGDGETWHFVDSIENIPVNENYRVAYDLDAALAANSVSLDSDVYLRLRHNGNSPSTNTLVDRFRVLRGADVFGPSITSQSPSTPQAGPLTFVEITFDEPIDGATFTTDDVILNDPLGNPVALAEDPVDSGDQRTWRLNFATPQTQAGAYSLTIGVDVRDLAGNPLNQRPGEIAGLPDDIFTTVFDVETTAIASLPYSEGFEGGSTAALATGWSFASTGSGTVEVTDQTGPYAGQYHLQFSSTASGTSTSDAVSKLDLSSYVARTDLTLDFWNQETTTGSSNYLQIWVSGDGSAWHFIDSVPSTPINEYFHTAYDLDDGLNSNSITFDEDVFVRFRHNGLAPQYITTIDDVRIAAGIDVFGPAVTSVSPDVPTPGPLTFVDVMFNEPISPATFTAADVTVSDPLGNTIALTGDPVDSGDGTTWTLNFASAQSLPGIYRVEVSGGVTDLAGNPLNQSGDEINGGSADTFNGTFQISTVSQQIPLLENFDVPDIANLAGWSFATSGSKTIEVTNADVPYSSSNHLRFGQTDSGVAATGDAFLALDLSGHLGADDLTLDFYMKESSRSSSSFGNLRVSNDGEIWKTVATLNADEDVYTHFAFDLDAVFNNHTITLDEDVFIQLSARGFDNSQVISFDEVRIARGIDVFGPTVESLSPSGRVSGGIDFFDVTFDEAIDALSFSADDILITDPLGNTLDIVGSPVDSGDQQTWRLNLATTQTQAGRYRVTVGPEIRDVAGNLMNQDGDAANGEALADNYLGTATISAVPAAALPYFEDFDGGDISTLTAWEFSVTRPGSVEVSEDHIPHSGNQHLSFGQNESGSSIKEAVLTLDLSAHFGADDLSLDFQLKALQSSSSNSMGLQVSGDGETWSSISNLTTTADTYEQFQFDLDEELSSRGIALDEDVFIKFVYASSATRGMTLDDVRVARGEFLTLQVDQAAVPEDGSVAASVRITRPDSADLGSTLTVDLTTSDPTEVTVPSQVVIPVDTAFIDVPLTIHDDGLIDGPQTVSIIASGAGFGSDAIRVDDDEVRTLVLEKSVLSVNESDGAEAAMITVRRNQDIDTNLTVMLDVDDDTEAAVQTSVTILAGWDHASFFLKTNNDGAIDGTHTVEVTASATGYTDDTVMIDVEDDDTAVNRTIGGALYEALETDVYQAIFDVTVPFDASVAIAAGSELEFLPDVGMTVNGQLLAVGTSGNEIQFKSSSGTPLPGDWEGITFANVGQPRSLLDFVQVSHADVGVTMFANGDSPLLTISNAEVYENSDTGVLISAGGDDRILADDVLLVDSLIRDNGGDGVLVRAGSSLNHSGTSSPTVARNEIFNNAGRGVFLDSDPFSSFLFGNTSAILGAMVVGNHIAGNGSGGIYGVSRESDTSDGNANLNAVIVNNLIEGNFGSGITAYGTSFRASVKPHIVNNTIVGNSGAGIFTSEYLDNTDLMVIANNLIAHNQTGIETTVASTPEIGQIVNNLVFGNTGGNWINLPVLYGDLTTTNANGTAADVELNISADPLFVSPTDFHLQPGSVAINAGTSTPIFLPIDDFDGETRTLEPDIGYDEVQNAGPTVSLANAVTTLPEDTSTEGRIKIADIVISDDGQGTNILSLSGADSGKFEITETELFLKANVVLDFETDPQLDVTVEVDDDTVTGEPDGFTMLTLAITNVNELPTIAIVNERATYVESPAQGVRLRFADVLVNDDGTGTNVVTFSGPDADLFELDAGVIYLKADAAVDFETNPSLDITVSVDDASIGTTPDDSDMMSVEVLDSNEVPMVRLENTLESLTETADTAARIKVADIVVEDDALGSNVLSLGGADAELFEIDGFALFLKAGTNLDFETQTQLNVSVEVDDLSRGGSPDDTATLTVDISDVNEPPSVTLTNAVTTLPENADTSAAIKVADIVVTDDALGTNALTLIGDDAGMFEIVGNEMYLKTGAVLDFESNSVLDVTVEVDDTDVGNTPDDDAVLAISITDINEPPSVTLANTVTTLPENADTSSAIKVADIVVNDDALGTNALTLLGDDAEMFEVAGNELYLKAGAVLDFESNSLLDVTVEVDDTDVGNTPDDSAILAIDVTDADDAPVISDQALSVDENSFNGTVVGQVAAGDPDAGEMPIYSIESGNTGGTFTIDASTGVIRVADRTLLDFETAAPFLLTVRATDADNADLFSEAIVTITVNDVDETPGTIGKWVWNDVNRNGVQDNGERGLRVPGGVTVNLYSAGADGALGGGDDVLFDTTQTNKFGVYQFDDVVPDNYYLQFILPAEGYAFTLFRAGNWKRDSNADPQTGLTEVFPLAPNDTDLTRDAGILEPGRIGDRVWVDDDGDGEFDAGEKGLRIPGGMTVNLYETGADGNIGGGDDTFTATTRTNKWGIYMFEPLDPGRYYVEFILPEGYAFTQQNPNVNWKKDSNADPTTGLSADFNLSANKSDRSRDAGVVIVAPPQVPFEFDDAGPLSTTPLRLTEGSIQTRSSAETTSRLADAPTDDDGDTPSALVDDDDEESVISAMEELLTLDVILATKES